MLKYKPFTVFLIITVIGILMFFSSFIVSSSVEREFASKIPLSATVEITDNKAVAVYEYENNTYRAPLEYSSALKNGLKIPVYIDENAPAEIHIKNLTSVYILKFLSFPILFTGIIGMAVSTVKYKKISTRK